MPPPGFKPLDKAAADKFRGDWGNDEPQYYKWAKANFAENSTEIRLARVRLFGSGVFLGSLVALVGAALFRFAIWLPALMASLPLLACIVYYLSLYRKLVGYRIKSDEMNAEFERQVIDLGPPETELSGADLRRRGPSDRSNGRQKFQLAAKTTGADP